MVLPLLPPSWIPELLGRRQFNDKQRVTEKHRGKAVRASKAAKHRSRKQELRADKGEHKRSGDVNRHRGNGRASQG